MPTNLESFARAVQIQSEWIREYIDSGRLEQAKECAYAMRVRAEHALYDPRHQSAIPRSPDAIETPLNLLNSPKAHALVRAMRLAAECARAVDAERNLPYEGSYGEYLQHLADELDAEVNGPQGLRGME